MVVRNQPFPLTPILITHVAYLSLQALDLPAVRASSEFRSNALRSRISCTKSDEFVTRQKAVHQLSRERDLD